MTTDEKLDALTAKVDEILGWISGGGVYPSMEDRIVAKMPGVTAASESGSYLMLEED